MPLRGNKGPVVHPHGLTQCFDHLLCFTIGVQNSKLCIQGRPKLTISGRALTVTLLLCYVNCTVKSILESVVYS